MEACIVSKKLYSHSEKASWFSELKNGVPGQIRTVATGSGGRYSIHLSYGDATWL